MNLKKLTATILTSTILLTQFSFIQFNNVVYAEDSHDTQENISTRYFYNQLTPDGKKFYDVMQQMLDEGIFETGTGSKEVTGLENQEAKLQSYAAGNSELLNTMGAARDAFVGDHPDLFYIDFEYLTMRVTRNTQGEMKLNLGTGRSDNYINKDFLNDDNTINKEKIETEKAKIENKVNDIVKRAKEIQIKAGQDLVEQQIKLAHEEVIKSAEYKYEYEANAPYSVRTVYGVFGTGNAVCEGYSRALKMILDKLNIPCILVTGIYRVSENQPEEHMWTYVQLNGKWYGVDPTFDNTDLTEEGEEITEANRDQEVVDVRYFLVGADQLTKHIPTGIMSVSNFEFSYPPLESVSEKFDTVYDEGLLKVELDDESWDPQGNIESALYKISYDGKGYTEAAKTGHYILLNQYQEYADGTQASSGWSYPRPEIYSFQDDPDGIYIYMPHIPYFEVAVTDIAPAEVKDTSNPEQISNATTYKGSAVSLVNKTGMIYNPNGNYVAPPFVKRASPILSSCQYIGSTYHVSLEYDDVLIEDDDPSTQIGLDLCLIDPMQPDGFSRIQKEYYKMENFQFDGQSTITFDFTPSEMFADDSVYYQMLPTGLIGSRSRKKPVATSYFCAHRCAMYAYQAQGFDMNIYGKPVLMDDVDMNGLPLVEDMSEEQREKLSDLLRHRLTLVTAKTTNAQEKAMEEKLDEYLKEEANESSQIPEAREVYETETYNINLTLCKKQQQMLKDGTSLRIMLGFPAGYGPEDEGVTFKAYHYNKNEQGEIIGVEEIPCTITKLGLIIEVKSFSPFTIAAVEETEKETSNKDKTVVINTTEGGTITKGEGSTTAETITTIPEGGTESLKIKADDGYEIDEIILGDNVIDLNKERTESKKEYELKLDYSEISEENNMLKVAFAAESVHKNEQESGATVIAQPVVAQSLFTMSSKAYTNLTAEENTIKADAQTLKQGEEFEVTFSIDEFQNVGQGVNTVGGVLNYDKSKLQYLGTSVPAEAEQLKWKVDEYNEDNGKFIISLENDSQENPLTKETGELFTVKFKVLADTETMDTISLTQLQAGTGRLGQDAVATANDITTVVNIAPEKEDTLTIKPEKQEEDAKNYKIENTYITIPAGTTVKQFNDNVGTSTPAKYYTSIETTINSETKEVTAARMESIENEQDLIQTGDTVEVGSKTWTFVVRGDTDGDGTVGVNDLAKVKLHFIEKDLLYGAYLKAAETDDSADISTNDIARIKLYIIEKLTDLFANLS